MSRPEPSQRLARALGRMQQDWQRAQGERQVARESRAAQSRFAKASRAYTGKKQADYRQEDLQKARAKWGFQNPVVRRIAVRLVCIVALVSLAANIVMYSRWSNNRPLVRVGPRTVTRGEYYAALDSASGKGILSQIVLAELIRQAAASDSVPVSPADIDARIAAIRRTRPQSLPAQDTPALRDQVGLTLALENLRVQHVSVTPAEVSAFYNAHKALFALPAQMHSTVVVTTTPAQAAQATALLRKNQTPQAIGAHPGLHVVGVNGFSVNMNTLPPGIAQRLQALHQGDVQTFAAGRAFVTFGIRQREDALLPPLNSIYPAVVHEAKLAKAPSEQAELALLYQANKPSFDMANYAQDFREYDAPASVPKRQASLP